MEKLVNEYPAVTEIPIAWGDMDAFEHVNNVMYFKYFESARIFYFEKINFMEFMDKTGTGPILASTQCRYKIPLIYPDNISVGAKVDSISNDRFTMVYAVMSHKHKKIAAEGKAEMVTFNYKTLQKTAVPSEIEKRIIQLEKTIGHLL